MLQKPVEARVERNYPTLSPVNGQNLFSPHIIQSNRVFQFPILKGSYLEAKHSKPFLWRSYDPYMKLLQSEFDEVDLLLVE